MIPINIYPEAFHTVGIDFIGPILVNKQKKYLLVIIDYYTKWPEVFETDNQEAETVAKLLYTEIYVRYGAPCKLISDRGLSFLAQVITKLNNLFGIFKANTTAYHPQTDGLAENFNKTLIQTIKSYITEELGNYWSNFLPGLLFAYRTTPHASTGFSPFFLLFGRHPVLPIDQTLKLNTEGQLLLRPSNDIIDEFQNNLKQARHFVIKNIQKAQGNQKLFYDKGHVNTTPIKPNDFVFVKIPYSATNKEHPKKFYNAWKGPYKVIEVIEPGINYKIALPTNHHNVINIERIKRCNTV